PDFPGPSWQDRSAPDDRRPAFRPAGENGYGQPGPAGRPDSRSTAGYGTPQPGRSEPRSGRSEPRSSEPRPSRSDPRYGRDGYQGNGGGNGTGARPANASYPANGGRSSGGYSNGGRPDGRQPDARPSDGRQSAGYGQAPPPGNGSGPTVPAYARKAASG